jgi:hypothetical protein
MDADFDNLPCPSGFADFPKACCWSATPVDGRRKSFDILESQDTRLTRQANLETIQAKLVIVAGSFTPPLHVRDASIYHVHRSQLVPPLIARSISARALGRRVASALVMTHARLVEPGPARGDQPQWRG